jgi:aminopeptidase N
MMLWQSLWDAVQDAELGLNAYTDFVFQSLPEETNYDVIDTMAGHLVDAWQLYSYASNDTYIEQKAAIEDFILNQLSQSEAGSDIQKVWFDHLLAVAQTQPVLDNIHTWLSGENLPAGLEIDQDRRWNIVLSLNKNMFMDYQELLESEFENDPSDIGNNMYLAAQAIRPDGDTKSSWVNTLTTDPQAYKLATMRAIMGRLFPAGQNTYRELYLSTLLSAIPSLTSQGNTAYLMDYMDTLPFHYCSLDSLELLNNAIDSLDADTDNVFVRQGLLLNRQDNQRCLSILALIQQEAAGATD